MYAIRSYYAARHHPVDVLAVTVVFSMVTVLTMLLAVAVATLA